MEQLIFHAFIRFLKEKGLYSTFVETYNRENRESFKRKFGTSFYLDVAKHHPWGLTDYIFHNQECPDVLVALWCFRLLNIPYVSSRFSVKLYRLISVKLEYSLQYVYEDVLLDFLTDEKELDILNYV